MLAKMWKKIALFICIVAILFNVTYKLIHRTNLKAELEAVRDSGVIKFSEDDKDTEVIDSGDTNK
jgi:hypothetical protein